MIYQEEVGEKAQEFSLQIFFVPHASAGGSPAISRSGFHSTFLLQVLPLHSELVRPWRSRLLHRRRRERRWEEQRSSPVSAFGDDPDLGAQCGEQRQELQLRLGQHLPSFNPWRIQLGLHNREEWGRGRGRGRRPWLQLSRGRGPWRRGAAPRACSLPPAGSTTALWAASPDAAAAKRF